MVTGLKGSYDVSNESPQYVFSQSRRTSRQNFKSLF